jgi:hypothetical protein
MDPIPEDVWDAWPPEKLYARLKNLDSWWDVVGGWALDLWHGHQTRAHEDIEFAVLPTGVDGCRTILSELTFFAARRGKLSYLAPADPLQDNVWQVWGADLTAGFWRIDMMIERGSPETWKYKRDHSIQMPRSTAVQKNELGIRYLAPANVLLFKAKHHREKDEYDFEMALPKLSSRERVDLRLWLETLHPGHEWISRL